MPITIAPFNTRQILIDARTGGWTVEGIKAMQSLYQRIGGALAPSNSELQGYADAAQAAADGAQSTANTAQSTAIAASVAATNAQDDANTAQATADGAVIDAAAAQSTADSAVLDAATAQAAADAAQTDATSALSALAVAAGRVVYGSGASIASEAAFSYDATTNTLTVDQIKGKLVSQFGDGVAVSDNGSATTVGLFGVTPIAQPTTGGAASTFVAGAGPAVDDASTFDGYTIGQVVKALRNLGALA